MKSLSIADDAARRNRWVPAGAWQVQILAAKSNQATLLEDIAAVLAIVFTAVIAQKSASLSKNIRPNRQTHPIMYCWRS
jgi:hypothetical protein